MRHFNQPAQQTAVTVYEFSLGLQHEYRPPEGAELNEGEEPRPKQLLQVVLQMLPNKHVRVHVFEKDSPQRIVDRLINLLVNQKMLMVSQPNARLFKDAIKTFIQNELAKLNSGPDRPENQNANGD